MSATATAIRTAREKSGLTQQQTAALTGYSLSAIVKFEAGKRTPPARAIQPILDTIGKHAKAEGSES